MIKLGRMIELKTLKDLKKTVLGYEFSDIDHFKRELRKEAKKWYKCLETKNFKRSGETNEQWERMCHTPLACCREQQKFIKHFFNLEKE